MNLQPRAKGLARHLLLCATERAYRRPVTAANRTVLIIQPDHLGDVLLSQPAVRLIREVKPDHRLVALVGPWSTDIASKCWPVD